MSDHAINLLKAIETSDQEAIDAAFKTAISAKITDSLDARKIEIAQSIYGKPSDEQVNDSDDEEVAIETDTSEENGTEEV